MTDLRAEEIREAIAYAENDDRPRVLRNWAFLETLVAAARAYLASLEQEPDHAFLPVNGHPDDDECTYRSDGTDDTYCGLPQSAHNAAGFRSQPSVLVIERDENGEWPVDLIETIRDALFADRLAEGKALDPAEAALDALAASQKLGTKDV